MNFIPKKESKSTNFLKWTAFVITLSSFVWGYSISVLNVCIVDDQPGSILVDFNLNDAEKQFATALVLIGAWIGAVLTEYPAERFGRKPVLLLSNALYLLGTMCCALAISKNSLFLGRFLIGLACGGVTGVVPTLLTEISPAEIRGQITTLHQLQLTIGILMSGVIGFFFVSDLPSGWRYVNGFMILPVLLQCLLWKYVPESPRWLAQKQRAGEARNVLVRLRSGVAVDEIETEVDDIIKHAAQTTSAQPTWAETFAYRREMTIGSTLVVFQVMTGINTVIFYSARIFAYAGVEDAIAATTSVGAINVLMTVLSVYLVDRYGRRPLLLIGTTMMVISLFILSVALLYLDSLVKLQGTIAVASTLGFVSGFAIGFGAVIWVFLGEILPTKVRSKAMGFFMGISYLLNIFIATCTLTIIHALGSGPTEKEREKNGIAKLYFICCILSVIALLFIRKYVAETKGSALNHHIKQTTGEKYSDDEVEPLTVT